MDKESKKNYGVTQQQGIGTVQIADDVIAVIVGIAATEVEGIAALGDNITNELMSKVGIKNINKGVKVAINEGHVDDFDAFKSPQAFLDYLYEIGIENLPTRFTLFRAYSKTIELFPDWIFLDVNEAGEILRRKNVVKQFLSAYNKAKRGFCNKNCNN